MRKQRITVLRERHLRTLEDKPPCFIQEDSWRLFVAHVRDGRTIRKISRDTGLSRFKVGALLSRVDRDLELATAGERMHGQLTLDSPIEHLARCPYVCETRYGKRPATPSVACLSTIFPRQPGGSVRSRGKKSPCRWLSMDLGRQLPCRWREMKESRS